VQEVYLRIWRQPTSFDPERGPGYIRDTIAIIEGLSLPKADMEAICYKNAERILKVKPQK